MNRAAFCTPSPFWWPCFCCLTSREIWSPLCWSTRVLIVSRSREVNLIHNCLDFPFRIDQRAVVPPEGTEERLKWRHCTICDRLAPPRSWHCKVCRVCILKRDHHCLFTGCCVGQLNHRYFMCFVIYLFIGAVYALTYNSYYMWVIHGDTYFRWSSLIKLICPAFMLLIGNLWSNLQLLFYSLNLIAMFYAFVMLIYHLPLVLRGEVCAENGKDHPYNRGTHENLRSVFGESIHMALLSPLLASPLPQDGYSWQTKSTKKTS